MLVKGKVALVTAGASGIGLACIEEMLKHDILGICLVDINEQNGVEIVNKLNSKYGREKVIFVKADVTDKNQFENAFKITIATFNQLDIFFNNAGLADETNYESCLKVNLIGATHGLKLAIDTYLLKYKSGNTAIIINTASILGLIPSIRVEIYSASKFGVVGLTRNFGCDYHYKRTGVKVIGICPHGTKTPFIEHVFQRLFYKDITKELLNSTKQNSQTVEELAKCFMKILEVEENGSIWIIRKGKETKVEFPPISLND